MDRRGFLGRSVLAGSAAATFCFEEQALLGGPGAATVVRPASTALGSFPRGKIGRIEISRLICGGNLISGFAHSRDLIYVSELLRHYFTDEKVFETLRNCETAGINTCILRLDDDTLRILRRYRTECGGRIQWIAQVKIRENDLTSEARQAIDGGAVGVYVHGGVGDDFVARGRVEMLARAVAFIRDQGVIAGVAGHALAVPEACEQAGVNPDFYLKTFNSRRYWSAGPTPRHDSVWEETPEETMAFMAEVERPWIAYKVLGAGAIHPREGFPYAYQNGADFLCVGMFDFQVAEDAQIARQAIAAAEHRDRIWYG